MTRDPGSSPHHCSMDLSRGGPCNSGLLSKSSEQAPGIIARPIKGPTTSTGAKQGTALTPMWGRWKPAARNQLPEPQMTTLVRLGNFICLLPSLIQSMSGGSFASAHQNSTVRRLGWVLRPCCPWSCTWLASSGSSGTVQAWRVTLGRCGQLLMPCAPLGGLPLSQGCGADFAPKVLP